MSATLFSLCLALALPSEGPEDRARAKELFDQAAVARAAGRWEEVRRLLEASIAAYPQFSTAWNLVTADEQLDDRPAAEAVLLDLQKGTYGALAPKEQAAVKTRLEGIEKELGTLAVEVNDPAAALEVDGARRGGLNSEGRAELRVAAGTRIVVAIASDGRRLERSVDVGRQDRRALRFSFPPAAAPLPSPSPSLAVAAPPPPVSDEPGIWSSPWFWAVVGVVAAGAGTAAILGATAGTKPPVSADFNVPRL
ncbi:MAG: hypothetical protein U1E65_28605 [Myxococcota bacterium]